MTDFEPQTIPPRLDITPVRDYSQKEHPLPSEKALGLLDNIRKYKETLPDADNNRLAVIIPARRASHLLQTGLPILNRQIKECVDKEKIDGADIAIVLNRGGDEADQQFANDFQVEAATTVNLYEKGGRLYTDSQYTQEANLAELRKSTINFFFIHQEDVDVNSGTANALRTGFQAFVDSAKRENTVHKYYLTPGADNRLYTGKQGDNFTGNGLLRMMEIAEATGCFAVGAKLEPVVMDENGYILPDKKIAGLVRATANLHTYSPGAKWSPGGGTLSAGRDALAAQTAIMDGGLQVEDVSFDIVTSGLMGKDIRLTDQVRVVYSAPADRGLSITEQLKELRILKPIIYEWARANEPLENLIKRPELPEDWAKLVRWLQGQKYAENYFGQAFVRALAGPNLFNIIIENIRTILKDCGWNKKAIKEAVSLARELPSYLTINSGLTRKDYDKEGGVSW
ncbi:MAG: hypothetical protein ACD_52C00032G0001 [uncultured bacterium]|uniref:Uncharacterized protein n=1 Tax=Candidatus Woesebacteria bacterium RIFCSPHIGHO2_12_FULL_41_24 TaxID=1802510 RepID=A0A1F8ASZ4_9BACT|nr:MAG: hypothetical protein ACD_52C00032G0001 [uncultured bacterium]OGM15056.1 MAG: hypothetical protein A2W15_04485 [Candidatus Woesebacteria bacterium RBG_16_41_13]OGM28992.1 MAG: hypothetical protein A2873_01580 [Candidatus Woesebacteria bacterium RIFCSPHIGHO2_01_FULL_42_80]OGM35136.1 MAG: hypothetical protein A3D84_02205 [Candidatus Woesebacteria bacterium RIFCSPHIGHO2_02_FULL_42_20]OGM54872.1 MAG: hypothetical protein A3E44_01805 [Candidatus Woesebacteria bacterium RIFCSPHIGHO2_12_FULL_41